MHKGEELSGNIKLRLPKSLHAALLRQAQKEGVSLNQLCLMYVSAGIAGDNLGTEEFNHRLERIAKDCEGDSVKLFKHLKQLDDEITALKPLLLEELKSAYDENRRNMYEYIEALRYIYPIYHGDILGQKYPMLKVPSVKIVLKPRQEKMIDFKAIEGIVSEVCNCAVVSYGDYDYFVPMEERLADKTRIQSTVIHICCKYDKVEKYAKEIYEKLTNAQESADSDINIRPCYLHEYTSILLKEKYDIDVD